MLHRTSSAIADQVLLTDIGNVAGILILSEQMIERLITVRPDFLRDGFVPFFAVGKDGVDIEYNSAKIEQAVTHHLTNAKPRLGLTRRIDSAACMA